MNSWMKTLICITGLALAVALPAAATPITWTLANGTVQGGGALSGSFTLNLNAQGKASASGWSITAGSQTYTSANSTANVSSNGETLTLLNHTAGNLSLTFSSPLDVAGNLSFNGSLGAGLGAQAAVSGNASAPGAPGAAAVPEPATWTLLASGLLALAALAWLRRKRPGSSWAQSLAGAA